MGADIHWIIERQDQDGHWHATASKSRMWSTFSSRNWDANEKNPSFQRLHAIGDRNYLLFGMLSDVRFDAENPLAKQGVPQDASRGALEEIEQWNSDGHSHGWLDPLAVTEADILNCGVPTGKNKDEVTTKELLDLWSYWIGNYRIALEHETGTILPSQCYDDEIYEVVWADLAGIESAHEALRRAALSRTLHPPLEPGRSRILVFYDN